MEKSKVQLNFKPILIGRNQKQIKAQLRKLERYSEAYNNLAKLWHNYFNEPLSIELLKQAIQAKDLKQYLEFRFLNLNEGYQDMIKKLKVKIEKLRDIVEIPPCDGVINQIEIVKESLISFDSYKHPNAHISKAYLKALGRETPKLLFADLSESILVELDKQLLNEGAYQVTKKLEESVTEKYSYYTKNIKENLVFLLINRIAGSINDFTNLGWCIDERYFSENSFFVKYFAFENAGSFDDVVNVIDNPSKLTIIQNRFKNLKPEYSMFDIGIGNESLVKYMENFSEEEAFKMYEQLIQKD